MHATLIMQISKFLDFSASTPQWAVGGPSEVLLCGFESDLEDLGCQVSGGTLGRSGHPVHPLVIASAVLAWLSAKGPCDLPRVAPGTHMWRFVMFNSKG